MGWRRNESGQVLVVVALSMTVLIGFIGFATDIGVLLRERRIAQSVADGAAVGGATEALNEGTPSSVTSGIYNAAALDASLNGYTPGSSNGVANSTTGVTLTVSTGSNISISGYNSNGYIEAVVSKSTPTIFMATFGAVFGHTYQNLNVSAAAIASDKISSSGCFYGLNPGDLAIPDVTLGGSSEIFANRCGVNVNGNIDMGGHSNITASYVVASGSITNTGSSSISGTETSGGGSPVGDPMSYLQYTQNQPSNLNLSAHTCTAPAGSGMLCVYDPVGGLNGTLVPNTVYVFDSNFNGGNGPTVSGGTGVSCTNPVTNVTSTVTVCGIHDTIYLMNNIPLNFKSNGTLNLYPPGYGGTCTGSGNPLCGITVDAPTDGSGGNGTYTCSHGSGNNYGNPGEIYFDFGSSATDLQGIIYAPYMQMFVQDQGASTNLAIDLVLGNFCSQAATLNISGFSGSQSPLTRVGLIY